MKILDKEEFRIKLEEINNLVEKKDYKGAMEVVDSIDWRRVKNVRTLCVVGEIYAANKRYEDSREIFLLAYHRAPIGKNILYRLIEVSLKMGDIEEAVEFFDEFKEIAPNDNTRYVLKYKISKAKKVSLNEQIAILEEYKEKEFTEKWTYELAKLYYKAGNKEKCLELCNELILWFNEGTYVMKAYDLKMRMGVLSGEEKEKYEQQFVPKLLKPEDAKALKENAENTENQEEKKAVEAETDKPQIESIEIRSDRDLEGAQTLQEKISKGIRDIFRAKQTDEDDFSEMEEDVEDVQEEMIKRSSDQERYEEIPELEEEGIKPEPKEAKKEVLEEEKKEPKFDFSQTIRMPELKIPESMRNMTPEEAPEVEDIKLQEDILEKISQNPEQEKKNFEFNLEDTILAAASAQGIEIPEEKKEPEIVEEPVVQEEPEVTIDDIEIKEKESGSQKVADTTMDDLEEELFTEEDLRQAEAEFLKGPMHKQDEKPEIKLPFEDPVTKPEVPDLEMEDLIEKQLAEIEAADEEDEEDDFIKNLLSESEEDEEEQFQELEEEEIPSQGEILSEDEEVTEEENFSEEDELERFIDSMKIGEEEDALDIVPREKELREEEKQLFTYFVKIPGMKEQLLEALSDAQLAAADATSKTGNIVVMGGSETGKTRLISSLIPAICKELNMEASSVAYVFAEQINGKDIRRIVKKLSGGFFVIENANQLDQETAEQLNEAMEEKTAGLTVILEDEKIGMRKMLARYPKLAKKFTSVVNIPVFTNDELANFAKVYAKENGYKIDNMGMLALYNLIGINQKEDEPMNIGAVKNLIDAAISKSQGGRLFKKNPSKKRMDREGYIVLYEKDFSGK